ncbi:Methylase_S domain-containing protein [Vibrio chagasii]|nr:Methylase_S domain-containing protein [Vibrio chagasii]
MALAKSPAEIVQESKSDVLSKHATWERVNLIDVAALLNGFAFKSSMFSNDPQKGMPLIRIRDVMKHQTNTYYSGEYDEIYVVRKGDLLIGMDGDFNAAVWQGENALLNQRVCKISIFSKHYDHKFLSYVIQPYLNAIHAETSSVTVKHLSSKTIGEIPLPLPPLVVQKLIVEKIEELFSHIDAGVEGLKQAKAKLQQYRQSVLKDAVTGKLTEQWRAQNADKLEPAEHLLERILDERRANWEAEQLKAFEEKGKTPKNDKWKDKYKAPKSFNQKEQPLVVPSAWEWCYFESLGVVSGGLTKNSKRKSFEKKLPYLRVANVYANELRLEDIQEIGVTDTELDRVLLEDKDLLIVEGNGSPDQIGRLAVWDDSISPCVHQNHLIKVRLIDKELCDFVVYWLMSLPGREQIKSVASSTSGLYTLSISKISGLPIPLPSINEAIEISKLVTDKLEAAQRTEDELTKKIKHSEQLKSSILSKAFSGQLVENHATEETAEQLLEKIRLEKGQAEQKAKLAKKKPTARAKKMKRRPILDVLMETKKALNVDELFELSGFQGEVTPEVVEEFYQELKDVTATKGVNVTPVKVGNVKQSDLFEYKEIKPNEA